MKVLSVAAVVFVAASSAVAQVAGPPGAPPGDWQPGEHNPWMPPGDQPPSPVGPPPAGESCWYYRRPQNEWVNVCQKHTTSNTVAGPWPEPTGGWPEPTGGWPVPTGGWGPLKKRNELPWKRTAGRARPPSFMTKHWSA